MGGYLEDEPVRCHVGREGDMICSIVPEFLGIFEKEVPKSRVRSLAIFINSSPPLFAPVSGQLVVLQSTLNAVIWECGQCPQPLAVICCFRARGWLPTWQAVQGPRALGFPQAQNQDGKGLTRPTRLYPPRCSIFLLLRVCYFQDQKKGAILLMIHGNPLEAWACNSEVPKRSPPGIGLRT